ncbi:MAG: hypothetical protein KF791_14520 [Verrucomicrobiae bacterium]|nr:hypothetical protein [Verrucomicrobiae bacterium]
MIGKSWLQLAWVVLLAAAPVRAASLDVVRDTGAGTGGGGVILRSSGAPGQVHRLEHSADLQTWEELALFHEGPLEYVDDAASGTAVRFLRLISRGLTAADDGKNQIQLPGDAFAEPPQPPDFNRPARLGWVKFAILLEGESRVWFQHSRRHPFHYDFARLRLAPFAGLSPAEFDRVTLRRDGQQAVLGAILLPSVAGAPEYGIQFVGQDVWTREEVAGWFERVRRSVLAPPGTRALYVPTFEQESLARAERDWLATRGIEVASADRWMESDAVYADGWAVGRLVFVPGNAIAAAYADGRLRPADILLTDRVPAEVPFLAGIITLEPATPNSHVAILARGYGIPFVWFADPEVQSRLRGWDGREVALRTGRWGEAARVIGVEGQIGEALREQLVAAKRPAPLKYTPKQPAGFWTTNVAGLTPAALRHVGGKVANYGLLMRTLPDNNHEAIALTFDVWDAFLDQTLPGQGTLREAVAAALGEFSHPPDMALLKSRLATVRTLFTRTASFSAPQRAILLSALTNGPFNPGRKIRFRSSTNVEDSEDFTGAGLYDSYSGCLLDDLDDDDAGPSACDPGEPGERGVFRAIQRVYASFYNDNAFLERLRRGVKESEVGMAVLVHHSYPDDIEMANGVVVLHANRWFGGMGFWGEMVTQLGAVSVTNPDSSARPERVGFSSSGGSRHVDFREGSSLVPLGGHVMRWEQDYLDLVRLLEPVVRAYAALFPAKQEFSLDLEFKRIQPGLLHIKQVRPLPASDAGGSMTPFLFGEPGAWCVEEGEFGSPLAKHRLKCRLSATSDARRLDPSGLSRPLFQEASLTFRSGTRRITLTDGPAGWTAFTHRVEGQDLVNTWRWGEEAERMDFRLQTTVETRVPASGPGWVVMADLRKMLQVTHARAQPEMTWEGPGQTRVDDVVLVPCPRRTSNDLFQERDLTLGRQMRMRTQFWWPPPPSGISAGYTAPSVGFVRTEITGLTTEPLVLEEGAAQTYSPGHHNFWETFVLEPRLDPGVPASQLAELEAANIEILMVTGGMGDDEWWVVQPDGRFRRLR